MKDAALVWRRIPLLCQPAEQRQGIEADMDEKAVVRSGGGPAKSLKPSRGNFASLVVGGGRRKVAREEGRNGDPCSDDEDDDLKVWPSAAQFLKHPLALFALAPKDATLFMAAAAAGAAAKTMTAPLDRIKLLVQTHIARMVGETTAAGIGFFEAFTLIGKEGLKVAACMLREEGMTSFYSGLGASLMGIAPYIAINFCMFDLVKESLPEKYQKRPESSLATALVSATLATLLCYPLDTVRRQMQTKGSPYASILTVIPGFLNSDGWMDYNCFACASIVERGGVMGLYRGFVPNTLKSLPNSSIKRTTFDIVKGLIAMSQKEL